MRFSNAILQILPYVYGVKDQCPTGQLQTEFSHKHRPISDGWQVGLPMILNRLLAVKAPQVFGLRQRLEGTGRDLFRAILGAGIRNNVATSSKWMGCDEDPRCGLIKPVKPEIPQPSGDAYVEDPASNGGGVSWGAVRRYAGPAPPREQIPPDRVVDD